MKIRNGLKRVGKSIVDLNVGKWLGYQELKHSFKNTKTLFNKVFKKPEETKIKESFQEAMHRYRITEADLSSRQKEFKLLSIIFSVFGALIFMYAIYMAINKHFSGTLISLSLCLYASSQAFKFSFWHFQVKHQKLGCTLEEWLNSEIKQ